MAAEPTGPATNAPARLGLLEAVKSTLQRDPNIEVQQKQVEFARGAAQTAAGQFDPLLDTAFSRGVTRTPLTEAQRIQDGLVTGISALRQDITSYRLGVTKQLRSGVSIGPAVEFSRVADNANQEVAANIAQVALVINVPLLRGLGRTAVEAPERAARLNADAAELDLRHAAATRVFNTVLAYWNCRAALEQVDVLRDAAGRSGSLLSNLTELVRTGEFPRADLNQARADRAEKEADLQAGEQELYDARQALGLALGLGANELAGTPLPMESFPSPDGRVSVDLAAAEALVQTSLERRADYQSALLAERANEWLLVSARNNAKPQLDFNLQGGYTGVDQGSQFQRFFGAADPWFAPGPSVLGTLRLTFPLGNRAARGLVVQRAAAVEQAALRSGDLARNIASAVRSSLSQLGSAAVELNRLDLAFSNYQQAVANETEKMKLGNSTVLDQITLADRWSTLALKQIQTRARYASAVARVRYESGFLIPAQAAFPARLTAADLLTVPPMLDLPPPQLNTPSSPPHPPTAPAP